MKPSIRLRKALPADRDLLERWQRRPHLIEAGIGGDWGWQAELARDPEWREQLIADCDRAIGFVQIIDPARDDSHYWGEIESRLRAIDIWVGEPEYLGRGYGSAMMRAALTRCFADDGVDAVLVDPLASNTRAQRFYRRFGFEFVAPRRFGDDDCHVYRLTRAVWSQADASK